VLEIKHTIYQLMFHKVKRYNKYQFMKLHTGCVQDSNLRQLHVGYNLPLGHRTVLIDIIIHVIILTMKSLTLIIISYES
jgi:hypothetical protein